jgi:hypothetical protein
VIRTEEEERTAGTAVDAEPMPSGAESALWMMGDFAKGIDCEILAREQRFDTL